jgi:hypothetical protein
MGTLVRFAIATTLLASLACGTGDGSALKATLRFRDGDDPSLARDRARYSVEEEVYIEFELRNTRKETLITNFVRDPPVSFHIGSVRGGAFTEVYSEGTYPRRRVHYVELSAGETFQDAVIWDLAYERSLGKVAAPGLYEVQAVLTGSCEPHDCTVSANARFEIVP